MITVLLNPRAGTANTLDLSSRLTELLHAAHLPARIVSTPDAATTIEEARAAAASGAAAVVAAGGDGTVSSVAAALVGSATPLGVLPLGTLNHFARDLGIPFDLPSAVRVLVERRISLIDVGEVNGRTFVNNSSIGVYPDIVVQRDELRRQGHRKWTAFALATARTLRRYRGVVVRITVGRTTETARTPFLFIGNNEYQVDGIHLGGRDRLDAGRLFAYLARRLRGRDLPRLFVLALLGRARAHQALESFAAVELRVVTRRARLRVALDGEVAVMRTPLHYHLRPRALRVIVP